MKVLNEKQDIRRRSSSTAIFLHIPYLNYIFFLAIIRGAYMSVKNFHLFNKRNPKLREILRILVRYTLYCSAWSWIIAFILLFLFTWNPFGDMMAWYWDGIHNLFGGMDLQTSQYLFNEIPARLTTNARVDWEAYQVILAFIGGSFFVFSLVGVLLGILTNTLEDEESGPYMG